MEVSQKYIKECSQNNKKLSIDMIKKDLVLSYILQEISNSKIKDKLIFKGGTLLSKYYLNYHRFSEDLDFIYSINLNELSNTQKIKHIKEFLKKDLIPLLIDISKKYGFCFKNDIKEDIPKHCPVKSSKYYYKFYIYENDKSINPIKIDINFIDNLLYDFKEVKMIHINNNSQNLIYPLKNYKMNVYSIYEIILEKIRAIITRDSLKERDFFDLYLIYKKIGNDDFFSIKRNDIILKLKMSLLYLKDIDLFFNRIENISKNLEKIEVFLLSEIDSMVLIDFSKDEYFSFCKKLRNFILSLNFVKYDFKK